VKSSSLTFVVAWERKGLRGTRSFVDSSMGT
jgi:hypothetical protein